MKEIALNQLDEGMWISDIGSLNFGPHYACEILRCRGTRVVLQGDPLWSIFCHDVFFKVIASWTTAGWISMSSSTDDIAEKISKLFSKVDCTLASNSTFYSSFSDVALTTTSSSGSLSLAAACLNFFFPC